MDTWPRLRMGPKKDASGRKPPQSHYRGKRAAWFRKMREVFGDVPADPQELTRAFIALGVETRFIDSYVKRYQEEAAYMERPRVSVGGRRPTIVPSFGMSPIGYPCHYCGAPAEHIEHVWPRSRGGDDHPNNLVRSCQPCNSRKGTRSLLTMACPSCGQSRDPGDVETRTGTGFYHCRCGASWQHRWNLQAVKLAA